MRSGVQGRGQYCRRHFMRFCKLSVLVVSTLGVSCGAIARAQNCTEAEIVVSSTSSSHEREAVRMLQEEVQMRTGNSWFHRAHVSADSAPCHVIVGVESEITSLLPATIRAKRIVPPDVPEAYSLQVISRKDQHFILIEGRDERGVLYGIGALLRKLELSKGRAWLDQPLRLRSAPQKAIRGHQLGYRAKNNTYDAWNLQQFEEQIRDLAIFGANTIQLIAPLSDDAPASPLFPASAYETLMGIARILDRYGLNCSLYYPEMEADYADPGSVQRELKRFEDLVRRMPRMDELWVPGGDPGHTAPELLLPLVEKQAVILHRYHPKARVYISAQGMNAAQYSMFYHLLQTPPAWLTGVFFGPQSRDSFETQRAHLPITLPLIFYPDIAHTMHAQFPVKQWDPAFALTEGREPVNPRPVDEDIIYHHFSTIQQGFITYSEGVNDDVNKMLWTQWGWDDSLPAAAILQDYARYFIGPAQADGFAEALLGLEKGWRGPLAQNAQIPRTLHELDAMEKQNPSLADNWRFQMAHYRAVYDAYLQERYAAESCAQQEVLQLLQHADPAQVASTLHQADTVLTRPLPQHVIELRERAMSLGGTLFHLIGLQLSTRHYGASNWERGANLDRIDLPLNDSVWLHRQVQRIVALPEQEQWNAVKELQAVYDVPANGFKDDLGNPWDEPHLVHGATYKDDPEMYRQAIDGVSDHTPLEGWRWAELTYAEALYEAPLSVRYKNLSPTLHYRARVVYAGEDYALPLRMVANGSIELQSFTPRKGNPAVVEYDLPFEITQSGQLLLEWWRPEGLGGSGRGRQIAEIVLYPIDEKTNQNP